MKQVKKRRTNHANIKYIFWNNNLYVQGRRRQTQFTAYPAEYGEYEAVFDLDSNKMEGELPRKKEKQVEVWIDIHKEDLMANWKLITNGQQVFRIPPLQ